MASRHEHDEHGAQARSAELPDIMRRECPRTAVSFLSAPEPRTNLDPFLPRRLAHGIRLRPADMAAPVA